MHGLKIIYKKCELLKPLYKVIGAILHQYLNIMYCKKYFDDGRQSVLETPIIEVGSTLTIQKRVEKEYTAHNYGSGLLDDLLATPSLIAFMIEASAKLIDDKLQMGTISVGRMIMITHDKPTVMGSVVCVKASVKEFDGRRIVLDLSAYDEKGKIAEGIHERLIVDKELLLQSAYRRAAES